jgi:hypothetical protein
MSSEKYLPERENHRPKAKDGELARPLRLGDGSIISN